MKYHIAKSGDVGKCTAEVKTCPLNDNPHFATPEEARQYYEKLEEENLFSFEDLPKTKFITPMPKVFYHVTRKENFENIMANGLNPATGERSTAIGEEEDRIYFFDSIAAMEDAFASWLGDEFDEEDELILLSIPSSQVENAQPTYDDGESSTEWTTTSPISKKDITLAIEAL